MATIREKRTKITKFLVDLYNQLDPSKKNSDNFLAKTAAMSDAQFIAYFTTLVNDPKKHLYLELEAFVNEPSYEMVEDAANNIVGDKYCHLFDYIAFPHISDDPEHPVVSVNKIYNGYINMRRVQQVVNHKTHIPTSVEKRDPKTGQVSMESKAARISDVEQYALICQGSKNILKEMFGPRGGDPVMRTEMEHQIATTGSVSLDDLTDNKMNKTSLNTANVYFTAAGLETDLVTKNGILPRTINDQYEKARTLDRKEGRL